MDTRLEKRIKSIRSLPQGQFNKYRQMFDSLMKTRCHRDKTTRNNNSPKKDANSIVADILASSNDGLITTRRLDNDENLTIARISETRTPTFRKKESLTKRLRKNRNITDDEKSQHLRVDSSSSSGFQGISDETNLLLNSLCATNQQIAEFFERSPTLNTLTSSSQSSSSVDPISALPAITTTSDSSALLSSSSLISSSPLPSISISNRNNNASSSAATSANSDLETSSSSASASIYKAVPVSPIELVTNKQSATLYQPNDTIITYIIENDSVKDEEEESVIEQSKASTAAGSKTVNFFSSSLSSSSHSSSNKNKLTRSDSKKLSSLSPSSTATSTLSSTNRHLNNINQEEYQLFSSTISTVLTSNNNYLDIDEHDDCDYDDYDDDDEEDDMDMLSDDSYDEDELVLEVDDRTALTDDNWRLLSVDVGNRGSVDDRLGLMMSSLMGNAAAVVSSSSSTTNFSTPPPKPARTFEHDLYLSGKSSNSARSSLMEHSQELLSSISDSIPLRPSRCLEHIYESLPSVDQLSLQENSNNAKSTSSIDVVENSNKGKANFKKGLNFVNFANLVVANKSEVDLKKLSSNNDKKEENKQSNLTKSKLAHSEPNLSEIGRENNSKKNQNVILKPFGRFLNTLKKTLSRKSVLNASSDDSTSSSSSSSSSCQLPREMNGHHMYAKRNSTENSVRNVTVEWRNRNNNRKEGSSLSSINEKFITKSYIYSDASELNSYMSTLFDYVLVVGLQEHKTCSSDQLNLYEYFSKLTPIILWKYPEEISNMNTAIPEFCFPDPSSRTEYKKNDSEIFQFTLTSFDASRTYGYCIRVCQKNKNPIVICIISQIDALEMYYTVLLEAAKLYQSNMNDLKLFLSAIYHKSFPNRGESLVVGFGDPNRKEIILNRCIDRRLEHINLNTILNYPFDFVIDIFESFLTEKKIIFLSNKLSLLSSTIQAFETLLYPFNWPHTYIPVLPSYLIEMCDAPTPYIIGLMRSCKSDLSKYRSGGVDGDMLIVDLDKQRFIYDTAPAPRSASSNHRILPESLLKALKIDLYNLVHNNSSNKSQLTDLDKNVELCRVFLKVFVKTIGNYANFIVPDKDNKEQFIFLEKEFINEAKSPEIKKFLDYFTKTQLFEVFIVKKLTPGIRFGLMFDDAIRKEEFESNRHSLAVNVCSQKAITIRQLKNKDKTRKARF